MNACLKDLYDFADRQNIQFLNRCFSNNRKAFCLQSDAFSAVVMDNNAISSETEETCILAEELGHLETGAMYTLSDYSNPNYRSNILQAEARARRWAIKKLVSRDELENAFEKGYLEVHELAEYFGVTCKAMERIIEFYKS